MLKLNVVAMADAYTCMTKCITPVVDSYTNQ